MLTKRVVRNLSVRRNYRFILPQRFTNTNSVDVLNWWPKNYAHDSNNDASTHDVNNNDNQIKTKTTNIINYIFLWAQLVWLLH